MACPKNKVRIHLVAVGNAPILRKMKFLIDGKENVATLNAFLRSELKLADHEQVFTYCASAFSPSPQQEIDQLFQCFGARGELLVNYSITAAYG